MARTAVVAGVGLVPFSKPGASPSYHEMGSEAARAALVDAGMDFSHIQQAYVGYVYGDSTCGRRALYPVGMTGIPVVNGQHPPGPCRYGIRSGRGGLPALHPGIRRHQRAGVAVFGRIFDVAGPADLAVVRISAGSLTRD